ncbi:MAG: holo-ACP synthase [Firmicutes bacterium]|nr:holo-ACP synthase [Bacillota bacterium]
MSVFPTWPEGLLGVGVDLVEISRFDEPARRAPQGVATRLLTDRELADTRARRPDYLASRFAAKEAVMKALGAGMDIVSFRDIEIFQDELGKPEVLLLGSALARAEQSGVRRVLISISHTKEHAIAFAVACGGGQHETRKPGGDPEDR